MQHSSASPFNLEAVRRPLSERVRPTPQQLAYDVAAASKRPSPAPAPERHWGRLLAACALGLVAAGLVTALARAGRLNRLPRRRWS